MKKLLILIVMLAVSASAFAQNIATLTFNNAPGLYLVTANRAKVYSIETTSTNAVGFRFWDNDNTNNVPTAATTAGWFGTNYVNGEYVSRSTYATNLVTSYTNPVGYASWYTNVGLWSVTSTNAASTNAVSPLVSINNGGAETRVTYVDGIFTRGVIVHATGNGTVTLYYRDEQ